MPRNDEKDGYLTGGFVELNNGAKIPVKQRGFDIASEVFGGRNAIWREQHQAKKRYQFCVTLGWQKYGDCKKRIGRRGTAHRDQEAGVSRRRNGENATGGQYSRENTLLRRGTHSTAHEQALVRPNTRERFGL